MSVIDSMGYTMLVELKNLKDAKPDIRWLGLDALDIKVYTSTDRVEIQGVIPLALPTTEQTLASLFRCRYSYIEGRGYSLSRA